MRRGNPEPLCILICSDAYPSSIHSFRNIFILSYPLYMFLNFFLTTKKLTTYIEFDFLYSNLNMRTRHFKFVSIFKLLTIFFNYSKYSHKQSSFSHKKFNAYLNKFMQNLYINFLHIFLRFSEMDCCPINRIILSIFSFCYRHMRHIPNRKYKP